MRFHRFTALAATMVALAAATAASEEKKAPLPGEMNAQFPDLSPDGSSVAFALHGDIWVMSAEGGLARRITISDSYDTKPRWSPDGKAIAFSSRRSGNWDVWTTGVETGRPVQVTFDTATDSLCEWSRDGKWIILHSNRGGETNIWKVPAKGGFAVQLTRTGGRDGSVNADESDIVFSFGRADLARQEYSGSSNWDIYVQGGPGAVPRKLTDHTGNDTRPFIAPDGKTVYYLSEREGCFRLFKTDVSGGEHLQVTNNTEDMFHPAMSADGKWIIFEMNFHLWRMEVENGNITHVPVTINADLKGALFEDRTLTAGAEHPDWSPDGQAIAFELRGDIWIMPATGGAARRVTSGSHRDEWPRFSPDGKLIAFVSDRSGNQDIWTMTLDGNNLKQLTFDKKGDFFHSWRPDGKMLAFSSDRTGNKEIFTLDLNTGQQSQITKDGKPDDDPVFSPDGKRIAFDSGRSGTQNIWVMDADGSNLRRISSGKFDQVPCWSPDGRFIVFERSEGDAGTALWVVASDGGPAMQVCSAGSGPRWSPKGDLIAFGSKGQGGEMVFTIEAPSRLVTGKPLNFTATSEVDLAQERMQVFQEAWKAIKDSFYDEKLHGVDWEDVKKRYEPVVSTVRTHDEVIALIDRMLGELKASHMGIWGGPYNVTRRPVPPTGYIGAQIVAPADGGPFVVEELLPNGPADKAWIRKGDRVFEVNGKKLWRGLSVGKALLGTVGKQITMRVGPDANPENSRILQITPLYWGQVRGIEYQNWVRGRQDLVRKKGGRKMGYIHLRMMGDGDLEQFKRALSGPLGKTAGLILDIRNNGGGHIHQDLLDILTRRPFGTFHPRGGKRTEQPALYYTKPVVVLINERSFSDAEVFPWGFKELKRGLVIGVPTNGGVIGTGSTTLINGATLRLPRVGWFGLDGKNLEGLGVEPDILVEETMEDRLEGRDPQLLKAIEALKDQIEKAKKPPEERKEPEKVEPKGTNGGHGGEEGFSASHPEDRQ